MFSTLRNRFGIPGVISVIALVFAMFGGAYAASNSSDGGKATASAKGKAGPRGKTGKTGPAGPAGPAGPQGSAGANGKDGVNGSNGTNGAPGGSGTAGKSVTGTSFEGTDEPAGEPCEELGGVEFKSASSQPDYACNGADGANGSPWTAGGTLPVDSTETGAWAFKEYLPEGEETGIPATISFNIPLAGALPAANVHYVKSGDPVPAACENASHPGTASVTNPEATSGNFCAYENSFGITGGSFSIFINPSTGGGGTAPFGVVLSFLCTAPSGSYVYREGKGSWAVTG